MMRALPLLMIVVGLAGCSGGSDAGDVEAANRAAANVAKTPDQLPADMPPQARQAAASAMGQAQAQQQIANDPARVRAMNEMKKQGGG